MCAEPGFPQLVTEHEGASGAHHHPCRLRIILKPLQWQVACRKNEEISKAKLSNATFKRSNLRDPPVRRPLGSNTSPSRVTDLVITSL